jgi:2-succinyl-6-hydroxy-2,4-cyclohexadiene-1-carboxylate synthase
MASGATLLHGFTGSALEWGEIVLEGLRAAGYHPVALDLPGHGERAGESDEDAFTLESTLALIDAAHHTTGPMVGYSMGGRVALHYASRYPGRISRLVLESASPGLATEEERTARRMADAELAERIVREGVGNFVRAWEGLPMFASQAGLSAASRERIRDARLRNDTDSLATALRGLGTGTLPSLWEPLPEIAVPTLVIVGELDTKFTEIGRRMVERMPDARLEIVPDAGHNVHLEAPVPWRDVVARFLAAS